MLFHFAIWSLLGLLIFLLIEKYFLIRNISRFKFRILVNGTRGKSSVTEYIAIALQASHINTIGKITGIIPTLISIEGTKKAIKRYGPARVQEQVKMVKYAAAQNADALVLECMSIDPSLQNLESRIFEPHIYVITNIFNDHQEELGVSEDEQAEAICSAIPNNSIVVTNEKKYFHLIKSNAFKKNSTVWVADMKISNLPNEFPKHINENIAIALKVCELLKLNIPHAQQSIITAIKNKTSDYIEYIKNNKTVRFLNAFAVNDVPSAQKFILDMISDFDILKNIIFILNTRFDRPFRTVEFAKWLSTFKNTCRFYLIGSHPFKARKELIKYGVNKTAIKLLKKTEISTLRIDLENINQQEITVIGLGNIFPDGLQIIEQFFQNDEQEMVRL